MSCNGCRVLRKGCSESCILRPCLQWIDSPEAQGHATVFVAKFFGRAGLMSFISAVPENQRPALFQSLLFEACGRTVNPVNGAVGLLWTGNWSLCQAAVETVLRGGALRPLTDLPTLPESDVAYGRSRSSKRKALGSDEDDVARSGGCDLGLSLMPAVEKQRPATPNSEGSVTTSAESRDRMDFATAAAAAGSRRLLNLFV